MLQRRKIAIRFLEKIRIHLLTWCWSLVLASFLMAYQLSDKTFFVEESWCYYLAKRIKDVILSFFFFCFFFLLLFFFSWHMKLRGFVAIYNLGTYIFHRRIKTFVALSSDPTPLCCVVFLDKLGWNVCMGRSHKERNKAKTQKGWINVLGENKYDPLQRNLLTSQPISVSFYQDH